METSTPLLIMKKGLNNLISQLAEKERDFLRAEFLAPVAGAGAVQVRIGSIVCRMKVRPRAFTGWGVFKAVSFTDATLVRGATMSERAEYLKLFPAVRLILIGKRGSIWAALPAQWHDQLLMIDGEAGVFGVDDAELFDTVIARFDGSRFWFDQRDPQADPMLASYLNESLVRMVEPKFLNHSGLTLQQRLAYTSVHDTRRRLVAEAQRDTDEHRLRLAIEHAGAKLRGFSELPDVYRVAYTVDGHRHVSVVRKNDLSVQSAGICLSGQDQRFDLASLVSVLREGQRSGMAQGMRV